MDNFIPIKGFDGYMINRYGEVLSLPKNGTGLKAKKLKQNLSTTGYWYVKLRKNKKSHHKTIHRMIAEAFIPNEQDLPFVNHIDLDKQNNSIDNLEWCTPSYNIQHAYDNNAFPPMSKSHKNKIRENAKKAQEATKVEILVFVQNKDNDLELYESVSEASRKTGFARGSISNTVKNGFVPSRKKMISIYRDDYTDLLRLALLGNQEALAELQAIEDYINGIA